MWCKHGHLENPQNFFLFLFLFASLILPLVAEEAEVIIGTEIRQFYLEKACQCVGILFRHDQVSDLITVLRCYVIIAVTKIREIIPRWWGVIAFQVLITLVVVVNSMNF